MKFKFVVFLFIISFNVLAQENSDSVKMIKFTPEYKFKDGLYLSFKDFKSNSPIPKSKIIAPHLNRNDYNFIASLINEKRIRIYDVLGTEVEIKPKDLWGFCDNGTVYIRMNDDFSRLSYIGSVSHFVADKIIYTNDYNYSPYNTYYYNRYNTYGQPTTKSVELQQYLLDMETGKVVDYTQNAVEILLMKDPELHDEYMSLRRKKKKQKMFLYLRKFNQRNPLYMPKK